MKIEEFWKIISAAKSDAGPDIEARVEKLRDHLQDLSPNEIQEFQNYYDEMIHHAYNYDLWGGAYIINGGCSDDGFRYFRDWLISEGQSVFETALKMPDSLAELDRLEYPELESYGYVALGLYEQKGGGELNRCYTLELDEPSGMEWTEEELPKRFPMLWEKYSN